MCLIYVALYGFVLGFPFGWSYVSKLLYLLAIYFLKAVVVALVPVYFLNEL